MSSDDGWITVCQINLCISPVITALFTSMLFSDWMGYRSHIFTVEQLRFGSCSIKILKSILSWYSICYICHFLLLIFSWSLLACPPKMLLHPLKKRHLLYVLVQYAPAFTFYHACMITYTPKYVYPRISIPSVLKPLLSQHSLQTSWPSNLRVWVRVDMLYIC